MDDRQVIAAAERPWRDEHVEALMRRRAEAQGDAVRATVAAEGRSRSSDPRVAAADWRRLHDPLEVDDVPEPSEPVEVSGDGYARAIAIWPDFAGFDPIATACLQIIEGIEGAWAAAAAVIDQACDQLRSLGIVTSDEPPPLNRRRHGSAAVCPRHGETRGGLCRRCAR